VTREASLLAGLLALAYMRTCSCAEHTVQHAAATETAARSETAQHSTCSTTVLDLVPVLGSYM
jgi:hypothetical protein